MKKTPWEEPKRKILLMEISLAQFIQFSPENLQLSVVMIHHKAKFY